MNDTTTLADLQHVPAEEWEDIPHRCVTRALGVGEEAILGGYTLTMAPDSFTWKHILPLQISSNFPVEDPLAEERRGDLAKCSILLM